MAEREKKPRINPITSKIEKRGTRRPQPSPEEKKSPEQRTAEFFHRPLMAIFDDILDGDYDIANAKIGRKIQVSFAEEFPKVGAAWRGRIQNEHIEPGSLWNAPWLGKPQSLIITPGAAGSCIRIKTANYFNPEYIDPVTNKKGGFVPEIEIAGEGKYGPAESDISRYLGLQLQDISKLEFRDDSHTLYLKKERNIGYKTKKL